MNPKRTGGAVLLIAAVMMTAYAGDALAFRMIQNTGTGRYSAGALVSCTDPGGFVHWAGCDVAWYLNPANQGSGKQAAVQNAMTSWTAVSGSCHTLQYAGTTNAGFVTDGLNTLSWGTGQGCSGSCLALTALVLAAGQVITETDVTFNNAFAWNTGGGDYDVEAIAAHELGHTLGLHHTDLASHAKRKIPTMYAYYFGTNGRTLETDDRSALQCSQNRYPPVAVQLADRKEEESMRTIAVTDHIVRLSARPRSGGAVLRYRLGAAGDVRLDLFDVSGRRVRMLFQGFRQPGEHEVMWDGKASWGQAPSGVYFARIVTADGDARATVILAE